MFKKITLVIMLCFGSTSMLAQPVIPKGKFEVKLAKMAGKPGEFLQDKEMFPKDYFLVPKNLPFLVGLTLHHPKSSTLGLTKEQIEKIKKIKKSTVPKVIKTAKDIKMLELKLAQNIAVDSNTAESQFEIVDAIGKLRIALTKAHLQCINDVRAVLNKEQYKKLLKYATVNMMLVKKSKARELVPFIHAGKMVMLHSKELGISEAQISRFTNEILKRFVPKIEKAMKKANNLEQLIKKGVYEEHKNTQELKQYVDELAKLKKEVTNYRIEAYLVLQDILTKEQFKKGMNILQGKNKT